MMDDTGAGAARLSGPAPTDGPAPTQTDAPTAASRRHRRFVAPEPEALAAHFPQLQIIELLGQGGMGAVYKARQPGLDRLVAVKILPPDVADEPAHRRGDAFAQRFTREARALAKLNHPNIVAVYDFGRTTPPAGRPDQGLYYFIMEYVDGLNLRQMIRAGALKPAEALAIVPQVCEALQFAHDEGVVHRDIKPENILIDKKGRVKIADFGLAKLLAMEGDASDADADAVAKPGAALDYTLTAAGGTMGTPHYMAPEQFEHAHEVDHRADIYSLGVVFYEMLTGELPIGRFAPPSKKVHVDVRLDEVVLRSLEKETKLRYQHASEVKTDVESISGLSASAARRMFGYDYKSKTTLFGWPLVHVATGIDPATGRKRIAKGVIAIGDAAVGGLAIGGGAVGVVAIGGAAGGLIALGGVSAALLLALGGLAIGPLAVGGLAVGFIAIGGGAVGVWAYGGGAWGLHALGGNANDPAAKEFFTGWAPPAMRAMSFGAAALVVVFSVVTLLVMFVRSLARRVRR